MDFDHLSKLYWKTNEGYCSSIYVYNIQSRYKYYIIRTVIGYNNQKVINKEDLERKRVQTI
jgi:hypothetical protein